MPARWLPDNNPKKNTFNYTSKKRNTCIWNFLITGSAFLKSTTAFLSQLKKPHWSDPVSKSEVNYRWLCLMDSSLHLAQRAQSVFI